MQGMLSVLLLELKAMISEGLGSQLLSAFDWWKQSLIEVFALCTSYLITLTYLSQTSELA